MTPGLALEYIRHALTMTVLVSGPLLLGALAVGLAISVLQAVMQLQEQTLTFIPKLLAVVVIMLITLPWMMREMVQYVIEVIRALPGITA
jgi:flagellar biosynthetic protein FliQ